MAYQNKKHMENFKKLNTANKESIKQLNKLDNQL